MTTNYIFLTIIGYRVPGFQNITYTSDFTHHKSHNINSIKLLPYPVALLWFLILTQS